MTEDKFYQVLVSRMEEMAVVPPQNAGILTPVYKRMALQLKIYPWKSLGFIAVLSAVFLYLLFGPILVKLASILQFGF